MVINCGGPLDVGYKGGYPWTMPNGVTLRFGKQFSYRIAADGLQLLTLLFVEPNAPGPGQRLLSVACNHQPIVDRLDIYAESGLQQIARSSIVAPSDGWLNLRFNGVIGNAVVTQIELNPLTWDAL